MSRTHVASRAQINPTVNARAERLDSQADTCFSYLLDFSEQKRRQAIREGFDRLTELVPGLEGQGRSEGLVLQRTVRYMREQLEERKAMIEKIEAEGGQVDDEVKR